MSISANPKNSRWFKVQLIVSVVIAIAFGVLVIRDFSTPMVGMTGLGPWEEINRDYVDIHEFGGFFFSQNLYFNPFPQLNLIGNQVFYPYGTSSVFNPWVIEADLFYSIFYSAFGTGPWLQIYFCISLLILGIGAFLLLRKEYGMERSIGAGLAISFGNFYVINKFPHHFNLVPVHWTVLGLIADFLIVKRIALRQPVPLWIVLTRLSLLFLTFGQDLGYIAGFGLTSFTVSFLFIAALVGHRWRKKEFILTDSLKELRQSYRESFVTDPWLCWALLTIAIAAAYLYLPLVFQIAREARKFDFTGVDSSTFFTNPLRLLIPYFPLINSPENSLQAIFRDSPEAMGAGSPGWFFLIVGAIGLWQMRHQIIVFIPLIILFLLCLFYHPGIEFLKLTTLVKLIFLEGVFFSLWITRKRMIFFLPILLIFLSIFLIKPHLLLLPTLKLFPWFAFNRVGGRGTIVYPVILVLFALHLNLDPIRFLRKRWGVGLLVGLACLELGTAYSFRLSYQQPARLDKSFFTYMEYVKQQPGEAVLDWTFCIEGSGAETICPYSNSGVYALRRFHNKKVMGQYFGRLHPSQVEPYFQAGWNDLFFPDETRSRQSRCFNPSEWAFFTQFFTLNDFAGINLYTQQIPEQCLGEFYDRFGQPVTETTIPGAGRVQFIPKSPQLRNQVNPTLGKALKFDPRANRDQEPTPAQL